MTFQRPGPIRCLCPVALALFAIQACTYACDIPVYKYTMQAWERDSYSVVFVHDGATNAAEDAVNAKLSAFANGSAARANLSFTDVDISDGQPTDNALRMAMLKHPATSPPYHVVLTPKNAELHFGSLQLRDVSALARSPKRKHLADMLASGKQGVLLLLRSGDKAADAAAQTVIDATVKAFARDDIEVGSIAVDRDDERERWLVRQLLTVETDLPELDDPMVFGTFGRGHVLEPYLGPGITEQNLAELVEFINGPCACEVKTSSAGVDLLTDYDWEAGGFREPIEERPLNSALFDLGDTPQPTRSTSASASTSSADSKPAVSGATASDNSPASSSTPSADATSGGAETEATQPATDGANAGTESLDRPEHAWAPGYSPPEDTPVDIGGELSYPPPDTQDAGATSTPLDIATVGGDSPDVARAKRRGFQPPSAPAGPTCFSGSDTPTVTDPADQRAVVDSDLSGQDTLMVRIAAVFGIALLLAVGGGLAVLIRRKQA